ncbi:MAG: class IV adenylate cyclase [Actinobacteria bacterium]|nr:class IV adenylate cyclase [Actinomycetota bacterium]MCG2818083.1 class IV adenylate cyclase [Actinomycetes bacterium]MBU4218336.1 class IV adenylate cyclase [Actinomycetota bacterium]MBU4359078.1 class IV adenylate cyclase [Actinomycetota bacterium]MBU4391183.1 class IV adenylate cyclase [Actinomycetota bacterium]
MRNIEIKARLKSISSAEPIASGLAGSGPHARLLQVDTYFNVPDGRFKLREEGGIGELIYYRRPDAPGPSRCDYVIVSIGSPAEVKGVLEAALGVRCVVRKHRTVYLYKNVRIHLDEVEGLGWFLEFEAVMPEGSPDGDGESLVRGLMRAFGLERDDLVDCSYCDLLEP